jgi:hypothetical protein
MQEGIQSSGQPSAALKEPGRVTMNGPSALLLAMWVAGSYQMVSGPPSWEIPMSSPAGHAAPRRSSRPSSPSIAIVVGVLAGGHVDSRGEHARFGVPSCKKSPEMQRQ